MTQTHTHLVDSETQTDYIISPSFPMNLQSNKIKNIMLNSDD